jgi:hypothetical protein
MIPISKGVMLSLRTSAKKNTVAPRTARGADKSFLQSKYKVHSIWLTKLFSSGETLELAEAVSICACIVLCFKILESERRTQ